jgi:hypothetical protein
MKNMTKANFTNAKDIYIRGLGIPRKVDVNVSQDNGMNNTNERQYRYNPNGKYERATRLGLCFRCNREDTDPKHRPRNKVFAYCQECMMDLSVGMERLELKASYEVKKWFGD